MAQIAQSGVHPAGDTVVARRCTAIFKRYDNVPLNSATDYITPKDMLAGRHPVTVTALPIRFAIS